MQYAKVESLGDVPAETDNGWRAVRIDPYARQLDAGAAYARECGALSNRSYLAELYMRMVSACPTPPNAPAHRREGREVNHDE